MALFPREFALSENVANSQNLRRQVATDGIDIFFWDYAGPASTSGFWKYDTGAMTETLIFPNTTFGAYTAGSSAFPPMLQTFDKTIFFCASMTNGDLNVWRYSPPSTLVLDLNHSPAIADVRSITLFADSNAIVAHCGIPGHFQTPSGQKAFGFWKANVGDSWLSTTFSYIADRVPGLPHHLDYFLNHSRDYRALGVTGWTQYNLNLGGPFMSCRFADGDWFYISPTQGHIPTQHSQDAEKIWHENMLHSTRENSVYSDDFVTEATATPAAFFVQQLNMPHRIRFDNSGGSPWDTEIFEFNGTSMILIDQDKPAGLNFSHFTGEGAAWAIRTDDGEVYYLMTGSASNGWGVYHRATAMAATPDSWAKFVETIFTHSAGGMPGSVLIP